MGEAALLACDWGTTNLRAWTLDQDGRLVAQREFELGVSKLGPGEAARRFAAEVAPALEAERLPAILCGMVGSTLGWTEAPYVDCPAGLEDLVRALAPVDAPSGWARIAPGLRSEGFGGAGDVMRGEETQLFGWLALHPERRTGRRIVCHPGTHAKWIVVEDGKVVRFATAMTGELFAVLSRHSVLRTEAPADKPQAFAEGLAAAGDGGALAARLFTTRARVVGQGRDAAETASYLSGLLIGAEAASMPGLLGLEPATPVSLLGEPELCGRYRQALAARGVPCDVFDGEAAAIAGLFTLYKMGAGS